MRGLRLVVFFLDSFLSVGSRGVGVFEALESGSSHSDKMVLLRSRGVWVSLAVSSHMERILFTSPCGVRFPFTAIDSLLALFIEIQLQIAVCPRVGVDKRLNLVLSFRECV